jgi:hypothetical protein
MCWRKERRSHTASVLGAPRMGRRFACMIYAAIVLHGSGYSRADRRIGRERGRGDDDMGTEGVGRRTAPRTESGNIRSLLIHYMTK